MWWGAFILGFVGSSHCLVMCGPLIASLPGSVNLSHFLISRTLYNTGRITTYAILGAIIGWLGRSVSITASQQLVSIVIGAIICLMSFSLIATKVEALGAIGFKFLAKPLQILKKQRSKTGGTWFSLIIGLLNGLLPCGLVYVALIASLATSSPTAGGVFMLAFGLGTFPAMLTMALIGSLSKVKFLTLIKKYGSYYVFFLGLLLIGRGLNLDIPYLSPAISFFYPNLTSPAICD